MLGFGAGADEEDVDPDAPLPTFEVQPAMLAVDLALAAGESRSCEFLDRSVFLARLMSIFFPR
jgi:hypothetical protein